MDTEFHQTMFELHQNVNKKETIVGWYATGTALNVRAPAAPAPAAGLPPAPRAATTRFN